MRKPFLELQTDYILAKELIKPIQELVGDDKHDAAFCNIIEQVLCNQAGLDKDLSKYNHFGKEHRDKRCYWGIEDAFDERITLSISDLTDEERETLINHISSIVGETNISSKGATIYIDQDAFRNYIIPMVANEIKHMQMQDPNLTSNLQKTMAYLIGYRSGITIPYSNPDNDTQNFYWHEIRNNFERIVKDEDVDILFCDLLEETILKLAGCENKPDNMDWNMDMVTPATKQIELVFENLGVDDITRIASYLASKINSNNISTEIIMRDNPNADAITSDKPLVRFTLPADSFIANILPNIKAEVKRMQLEGNNNVMDRHKATCENRKKANYHKADHPISKLRNKQAQIREEKYKQFSLQAFSDLNQHNILPNCDIIEESLLKIAGISTRPSRCMYTLDKTNLSNMAFHITGITEKDANQFVAFLKSTGHDENASCNPLKTKDDITTYEFSINIDNVMSHLLPLLKAKFNHDIAKLPRLIEHYQKICAPRLNAYRAHYGFPTPASEELKEQHQQPGQQPNTDDSATATPSVAQSSSSLFSRNNAAVAAGAAVSALAYTLSK